MEEVVFVKVKDPGRLQNAIASSAAGSLRAVAADVGTVSHSFVAALANGRRSRIRLDDAKRLAEVLGWDVADLFEVEGLRELRELRLA